MALSLNHGGRREGRVGFFAVSAMLALLGAAESAERRCGWYQNPTPRNHWLVDRDGTWTMMAQGGYEARGMDLMPDFTTREWVRTNGYYGFGCACIAVDTDRRTMRIARILAVEQLPLSRCRQDSALPRPQ
ncbi:MAG: hypothetical protein JWO26_2286 [Rhodospirillales bacterium]|nr:hypothetical protein [Rhodospirillales bacterium]